MPRRSTSGASGLLCRSDIGRCLPPRPNPLPKGEGWGEGEQHNGGHGRSRCGIFPASIWPRRLFLGLFVLGICLNLCGQNGGGTGNGSAATNGPAAIARKAFQDAQARYRNEPRSGEAAWQFARACFDLAELTPNGAQRAEFAEQGIAACEPALEREPNLAPAQYYLGMNLGQLARTKGLSALKLVKRMERAFTAARELDEKFDYAGPDRNLGLLYRDAPSLLSVGSRSRAKQHLERAAELTPDYPENRLNLCETLLNWNDRNGARRQLQVLDRLWLRARANFKGQAWASSWSEWEERRQKLRKSLDENAKPLESPRRKE